MDSKATVNCESPHSVSATSTVTECSTDDVSNGEDEQFAKPTQEEIAFGFCPTRLVDDVYNVVDDLISDASDTTEDHLRQEMRIRDWDKERIEKLERGADNLLLKLRDSVDRNFDKFELYVLRNIFSIPEGLELGAPLLEPSQCRFEDNRSETAFNEQMNKVDQELGQVLKKLKHTMLRRNRYENELRALEGKLESVEAATARINFGAVDPNKMKVLVETADKLTHTVEQLTELNRKVSEDSKQKKGASQDNDNKVMRGSELAREFNELKESFGNPEIGVLRNLMERL